MKALDIDTLNPGIRRVVIRLRAAGFDTCDSGDGVTHEHACDRDHAYVVMLVPQELLVSLAQQLWSLVRSWGVAVQAQNADGLPMMQASYDPGNDMAVLDLMNVDDGLLS